MGTNLSSGNQTVNGTVSTSIATMGVGLTIATATRTAAGTTAIVTVPANHLYRVFCLSLTCTTGGGNDDQQAVIVADGVTVLGTNMTTLSSVGSTPLPTVFINTAPNFVDYAAGKVINLTTVDANDYVGNVYYQDITV